MARVNVGPPLFWSGPRSAFALLWLLLAEPKPQLVPLSRLFVTLLNAAVIGLLSFTSALQSLLSTIVLLRK